MGKDLLNPVAPHWAFDIKDLILQQVPTSATEKKLIAQWDGIFRIMYLTDFQNSSEMLIDLLSLDSYQLSLQILPEAWLESIHHD